jgi:hypothetical protein
MSCFKWLYRLVNPLRNEWRLFGKDGLTLECRIVDTPAGAEIQFFYGGELYHTFVHMVRADAEDEARQKRLQSIERGWCEQPQLRHVAHTS